LILWRIEVSLLQMNCHVLGCEATGEGVMIDPGDNGPIVLNLVRRLGLKIVAIPNTHAHFNHVLPVVDLVEVGETFDLSDDEALRRYAERTYPNGATAEGVVIRPTQEMQVNGERLSFKVINLLYRN
jgi:glyoxylase-like metal-dependent hydrolase (beta-lactamase superfamily II)